MTLSEQSCIPCKGGAPMTAEEASKLLPELRGWELQEAATWLEKSFRFPNFAKALAWVNRIGALAEEQNHHPDLLLGWGYATVRLQTHAVGGLSSNDFIMAAKIDSLAK